MNIRSPTIPGSGLSASIQVFAIGISKKLTLLAHIDNFDHLNQLLM